MEVTRRSSAVDLLTRIIQQGQLCVVALWLRVPKSKRIQRGGIGQHRKQFGQLDHKRANNGWTDKNWRLSLWGFQTREGGYSNHLFIEFYWPQCTLLSLFLVLWKILQYYAIKRRLRQPPLGEQHLMHWIPHFHRSDGYRGGWSEQSARRQDARLMNHFDDA